MKAQDLMTSDPRCCRAEEPATEALKHMDECDCGAVPVVDGDRQVVGIVTDRDILFGIRLNGGRLDGLTVEQCMTRSPVTVVTEEPADNVVRTMTMRRIRRVPVVGRDGSLVGIIAQADVAASIDDDALVARFLREVSTAPPTEPAPER